MTVKNMVQAAVFMAFGVVLPIAFHMVGAAGPIFLPMHIPVLLAGLLLGPRLGLIVGVLTPILSSLTTGMPPLYPVMPMMAVELGLYGFTGGLFHKTLRLGVLPSLVGAMIAGRLGTALTLALFAESLGITVPPLTYVGYSVAKGMIGIVIQLACIPLLVRRLERFRQD